MPKAAAERARTRKSSPRQSMSSAPAALTVSPPAVSEKVWRLISDLEMPTIELRSVAEAQYQLIHGLCTHHTHEGHPQDIPFDLADVLQSHLATCVSRLEEQLDELRAAARQVQP